MTRNGSTGGMGSPGARGRSYGCMQTGITAILAAVALLLVTRRPCAGFAGGATAHGSVQIAVGAGDFIRRLNAATASLPRRGWALAEARIEVIAP